MTWNEALDWSGLGDSLVSQAPPLLTGAALALIGSGATIWVSSRARRAELADSASRYREPLLHAAYNLQSRLYNILEQQFLVDFLQNGNPREQQYAEMNTVFLIGQYLCWAEMIRDEGQFLAGSRRKHQRRLIAAMERVREVFADSRGSDMDDPTLRIFRGDQRAIGELFLAARTTDDTGPATRCMGYAAFVDRYLGDPRFRSWLSPVVSAVHQLQADGTKARHRLVVLQHSLVDLVKLIDPDGRRVSALDRALATARPPTPS